MAANDGTIWIVVMQWASRSVLILLVILSIWSIATMIQCHRWLKQAGGGTDSKELFTLLQNKIRSGSLNDVKGESLYESVVREATAVKGGEAARIDRSIRSLLTLKKTEVERGLTILATLGANAPFIGLFGTVLGIIQSFSALGTNQSTGSSVMVGISEALVATAVGLFVAIPAVIAFNFFSRALRVLLQNCEALRDLYVAQLKGS